MPGRPGSLTARFWPKVQVSTEGCWLWAGSRNHHGYGRLSYYRADGVRATVRANRLAWEINVGPIPPGLEVCHNCPGGDNPACVNPAHLFLGTHTDNMMDMLRKGRAAWPAVNFAARAAAAAVLLALLWTEGARADQPCRDDAGLAMPCSEVAEVERLPVRDEPDFPVTIPVPKDTHAGDADFTIDAGAGVAGTLTAAGMKQEPIVHVVSGFDLATNEKSPRLDLDARFGTAQGGTPSLSAPASFRAVSFEARLSQPLWKNLLLRPALLAGIEIRMETDGEKPRHQGVRYVCLGGQIAGDPGYFFAGVCGDERVSTSLSAEPAYLPSVAASWLLKLRELAGGNLRAYLVGKVVAYLRIGYGAADAGNASATVGFMVGGGNRRE